MEYLRNKLGNKGIALLFTLGILMLCLMAMMALISISTIECKSSSNYKAVQTARMAVQAGINRAMIAIQAYGNDWQKDLNQIYSYDSNAANNSYYTSGLGTSTGLMSSIVNGIPYYINYSGTISDKPIWVYLPVQSTQQGAIKARVAYKVFATSGKFDLSACLDSGYNANRNSTTSAYESITSATDKTMTNPSGAAVNGRAGRDISEIFMTQTTDTYLSNTTYLQKASSTQAGSEGKLSVSTTGRWTDFESLFSSLDITVNDTVTRNHFLQNIIIENPADSEVFWYDSNADSVQTSGELYHRFNLARTDWSSVNTSTILDTSTIVNATSDDADGHSIPWLSNMFGDVAAPATWLAYTDSGNFTTATAKKNQIAANLIDYCDADTTATSDIATNNPPTYVGLEKCPYINEIRVKIQLIATDDGTGHSHYLCNTQNQYVDVELVNLYNATMSVTATVYLCYRFDFESHETNITGVVPAMTISSISCPGQTYTVGTSSSTGYTKSSTYSEEFPIDVRKIKITYLAVKLTDNSGNLYDYSVIADTTHPIPAVGGSVTLNNTTAYNYYVDFEIADPRQNLNILDWQQSSAYYHADSSDSTMGSKNTICNPSLGDDSESNVEPWLISTAYIRNGAMQSPWELGLIHRGKKWQTINLKKFDPSKSVTKALTTGGGLYSSGDANILDQVKMTSNTSTYGKVNLNTSSDIDTGVFQALFANIMTGASQTSQGTGTDTVAEGSDVSSPAYNLANSTKLAAAHNTSNMLLSRAEVLSTNLSADNSLFYDNTLGLSQTTDAKKEEIIGKFINLTKAEKNDNVFTILSIGQAVMNDSTNTDSIVLSTQKIINTVQRNPISGVLIIKSFKYEQ